MSLDPPCYCDSKNEMQLVTKCLDAVSSVDDVCACVVNSTHSALSLVHVIRFIILIFVRCNRYAVITNFKSGISVSKKVYLHTVRKQSRQRLKVNVCSL